MCPRVFFAMSFASTPIHMHTQKVLLKAGRCFAQRPHLAISNTKQSFAVRGALSSRSVTGQSFSVLERGSSAKASPRLGRRIRLCGFFARARHLRKECLLLYVVWDVTWHKFLHGNPVQRYPFGSPIFGKADQPVRPTPDFKERCRVQVTVCATIVTFDWFVSSGNNGVFRRHKRHKCELPVVWKALSLLVLAFGAASAPRLFHKMADGVRVGLASSCIATPNADPKQYIPRSPSKGGTTVLSNHRASTNSLRPLPQEVF